MDLSVLKEKLEPILKNDAPNVGELILVWIAGAAAYAIVTRIEAFYMAHWYEFHFIILQRVPPQEHGWRVKYEHLQGEEFQINGTPACILALNVQTSISPVDDPNTIKSMSWKEMIDGSKREEDEPGGGCPDKCDTPCS